MRRLGRRGIKWKDYKCFGVRRMEEVGKLRKNIVSGPFFTGVDYDAVLDAEFGPTGTTKREVYEMQ